MYPWIDLGFFRIPSFGLMVATAFLVCHYLLKKEFKERKIEEKIIDDIVFYAALSAIFGSKIYYLIEEAINGGNFTIFTNISLFFVKIFSGNFLEAFKELQKFGSGLTFNGGLICALIFIGIYIYRKKLNFLFLADIITPYILLGHGIGRIGCFLVGDDYGIPSKLPWAISFPNGLPATNIVDFQNNFPFLNYSVDQLKYYLIDGSDSIISVHPTQIYEMTLYFVGFIFIKYVYSKRTNVMGSCFSMYLIIGGSARFLVEILRTNQRYFLNLSSAQYISLIMVLSGIFLMTYFLKKDIISGKN